MDEKTFNDAMPLAGLTLGQARDFFNGLISEKFQSFTTQSHTPPSTASDIMRADDALAYLHELGYFISKNALYNFTSAGRIPCRRIGKCLNFSRKELATWVAGNAIQKKAVADAASESLAIAQSARRKR